MRVAMLTTTDNPYDPFEDYANWEAFDAHLGYNTPGYLARIAIVADELPQSVQNREIEAAIDEIVEENIYGVHVKVVKEVETVES